MQRILIVDDDVDIRNSMKHILDNAGYFASVAEEGSAALELIKSDPPDLLIVDMFMPGVDGIKTLEEIKNDPKTQDIPIIMMSGAKNEMDLMKGLLEKPIFYIEKPFSKERLIFEVREIFKTRRRENDR